MSATKEYKYCKEYAHCFVKATLAFYEIFVVLSTLFVVFM